MRKEIFLFFISVGLLNLGIVQAQWHLEKCPTRNNLNSISLMSENSGWIVGDKGTVLYKDGSYWREYLIPSTENLYCIDMLDETNGWAVGANGTIISFDGNNWNSVVSPTKNDLFSVRFKDSENGIAVGEFGTIVIYKNGIWNVLENEIRGNLYAVFFENNDTWIGGGLECINVPIMKMVDQNGITLISNYDSYASIYSFSFINSLNGWAVGSPSTILHFDGLRWKKPIINDQFSSLQAVFFSDENNGICVGFNGTILIFSSNQWIKENSSITCNLNGAAIFENTYYAVGDSGTIFMKNLDANNITTVSEQMLEKIEIFPNPCDEILNFSLQSKHDNKIAIISLTNTYGQIFLNKELKLNDGNLSYSIVTKDFKNGLYILNIIIEAKITANKFIIQHYY